MSKAVQLKLAPYGETDYQEIREGNFAYVDKTRFIDIFEKSGLRTPFIVRPRRFGKTVFTKTLFYYYDKAAAVDFDKNFSGTWIGEHKTPLANQFYVLRFDFSAIQKNNFTIGFIEKIKDGLTNFCKRYNFTAGYDIINREFTSPVLLFSGFTRAFIQNFNGQIFLLIDEYDQAANELLSADVKEFRRLTASGGELKTFYSYIKDKVTEKLIARVFITGVTSISMDSMSSGFSIAKNLSCESIFASVFGFTDDELRHLIPEIIDLKKYGHSLEDVMIRMKELYNGYHFSPGSKESVFNASMCLYYLDFIHYWNTEPDQIMDPSVDTDLSKIRGILKLGRREDVEEVVSLAMRREIIPFGRFPDLLNLQNDNLLSKVGLLSTLIYLGYLTYAPGTKDLMVPNRAMAQQFYDVYFDYLRGFPQWQSTTTSAYAEEIKALKGGNPRPLIEKIAEVLHKGCGKQFSLHLKESDFQSSLLTAANLASGYEYAAEIEVRGAHHGFIDLLMTSTTDEPSYLFELKYLPKKQASIVKIEQTLAAAREQAVNYTKGDNIRGIKDLRCVSAVFVGTELKGFAVDKPAT